jgi:hypothetical protein
MNASVGFMSGAITGGSGFLGASIASNFAKTSVQGLVMIGTSTAGGAVSGAASTIASNKADKKDKYDGIGKSIFLGAVAGGVGSGIGHIVGKLAPAANEAL